ncbi:MULTISPECIES: hypothetical protein [Allobacillus]|nr:hypothetical protein [Allobacillus salarius]
MTTHSFTLEMYVEEILKKNIIPRTSHERLYLAIQHAMEKNNHHLLYGMDELLEQLLTRYFRPAAKGYDIRKRMLVLIGPPGSGKSTFVQFFKQALSDFTETDQGAVYRIFNCPLHENPLHALPQSLKRTIKSVTGYEVHGELSPLNTHKLTVEWGNDWRKIPVERITISENERRGIGTFLPGDPQVQEISDLMGEVDFSTITDYGSQSHPYAYRYDGELQVGNQGILELQELFKLSPKLLYPLLSVTEEQKYKIPRQAMTHSDLVIIGHSNPEDFEQFFASSENRPLASRMIIQRVPYNLNLDEEVKLYKSKLTEQDLIKIQPFALESLAATVIYSRLQSSRHEMTKLEKISLYQSKQPPYESLKQEFTDEGMDGLDPRLIFHILSMAMANRQEIVTCEYLLHLLSNEIKSDLRFHITEKEKFLTAIEQGKRYFYGEIEHFLLKNFAEIEKDFVEMSTDDYLLNRKEDDGFLTAIHEHFNEKDESIQFKELPEKIKHRICQLSVNQWIFINGDLSKWYKRKMLPKLSKNEHQMNAELEKIIKKYDDS